YILNRYLHSFPTRRSSDLNDASRRVAEIPGIGALTASALVASIGDAKAFANGRQLAAWMGLVPRQYSSGGKPKLLGISKRGDKRSEEHTSELQSRGHLVCR